MSYSTWVYPVIGCYAVSAVVFGQQIISRKASQVSPIWIGLPVLLLHTLLLASGWMMAGGLDLSLTKLVSLVSLVIALVLTLGHKQLYSLLLLPPVFLFNACALIPEAMSAQHYLTNFSNHPGLAIHVGLALIAYAILIMAALMAIQVWVIDYRLKQHGTLHGLRPLVVVDKQLNLLLRIGFVFLTLSIVTGWYLLDNFFAQGQRHKAVLTILAWLIYG